MADVSNPLFYEWSLFMRKSHLKENEIVQYEAMDSAQIGSVFCALGVQKGAQLFYLMLQSYRIAARVANAAWSFFEKVNAGNISTELQDGEEIKNLHKALKEYSPENFSPHISDVEFAAECFEKFYNEACEKQTKEEVEELLFEWTRRLHEIAASTPSRKVTVRDVVHQDMVRQEGLFNCFEDENHILHLEKSDMNTVCGHGTRQGKRLRGAPTCAACLRVAGEYMQS